MTTDYYKLSLEILIELLKDEGYENWEKWLLEDIRLWETEKTTEHHLSAYGGMGSFNDVPLGTNDTKSLWKNRIFGLTQSFAYQLAQKSNSVAPNDPSFYGNVNSPINGWRCRSCGHAKINSRDIEIYLASTLLPKIFAKYIAENKLTQLLEIDKLINSEEISLKRKATTNLIQQSGIELSDSAQWLWTCPKCQSQETCAYRWDLTENDTKLVEADDNLSMK